MIYVKDVYRIAARDKFMDELNNQQKKNWNEHRKAVNFREDTWVKLDEVRINRGFKSLDVTTSYLLNLEEDLKKNNLIIDQFICKKCDKKIEHVTPEIAERLHRHMHWEFDEATNCRGHIRKTYGLKTKVETPTEKKVQKVQIKEKVQEYQEKEETDPRIIAFNKIAERGY